MVVTVIYFSSRATGGDVYERDLVRLLREREDVRLREYGIATASSRAGRLLEIPVWAAGLRRTLRRTMGPQEVVVASLDAYMLARPFRVRTIVVVHHMDFSASRWRWWLGTDGSRVLGVLAGADSVVVVSEFWRAFLEARGLKNIRVIHNGFDVGAYDPTPAEVEAFRARHGLNGKPIIYLGREGPGRGAAEAFNAVKDIVDAHFIVSCPVNRRPTHVLPGVRHLHLSQRDYVALLSAATLTVTMSSFDEGWSRVAHESLLCGTPVIGSGRGGMRELLEGAGQIVCSDLGALRGCVERLLTDATMRVKLGEAGKRFARSFTYERFLSAWIAAIGEVAEVRHGP